MHIFLNPDRLELLVSLSVYGANLRSVKFVSQVRVLRESCRVLASGRGPCNLKKQGCRVTTASVMIFFLACDHHFRLLLSLKQLMRPSGKKKLSRAVSNSESPGPGPDTFQCTAYLKSPDKTYCRRSRAVNHTRVAARPNLQNGYSRSESG